MIPVSCVTLRIGLNDSLTRYQNMLDATRLHTKTTVVAGEKLILHYRSLPKLCTGDQLSCIAHAIARGTGSARFPRYEQKNKIRY